MHRSLPALFALVLVFASIGAAAPIAGETTSAPRAASPVVEETNTTSYLALAGTTKRSEVATTTLDVSGALATDSVALHSRYRELTFEARYQAAPNDSAREAVLRTTADQIEHQVDTLRRRERAARAAFNADQITTGRYLRRLAILDAEAGRLDERVSRLHARVEATDGEPVSDRRLATMRADLVALDGPVRSGTAAAMAGHDGPLRTYVETSGDGVVLASVSDSDALAAKEYVREAYVRSARNKSLPNQFANGTQAPLDAVVERARALYPWTFNHKQGLSVAFLSGRPSLALAGVYSVAVKHAHGTARGSDLVAYLDGGTTDVFREVQYKNVERVPTVSMGENRTERLVVRVNATRPGGPAEVTVTDTVGTPVTATVYVDGEQLGQTGADGQRWFVAPRGRTNVTVVHEDAQATVIGRP